MLLTAFASAAPVVTGSRGHCLRAERGTTATTQRVGNVRLGVQMGGFGFIGGRRKNVGQICACMSGKEYGKCCRPLHMSTRTARMAEDLLRSRYSAYAYKLPEYIMKTTAKEMQEFDKRRWHTEITQFSTQFQFVGGVDVLETTMTGPTSTTIVFR